MKKFEVVPLVGVGAVKLGMTRKEARKAMPGKPESFNKSDDSEQTTDAYHENGLQIFYAGKEPVVEYIELSRDSGFTAIFKGNDVFEMPADELVKAIKQSAPYDEDDPELGYSYIFPELEMSVWRPVVPEGEDDEGQFFATIGIGVKGYYSADED